MPACKLFVLDAYLAIKSVRATAEINLGNSMIVLIDDDNDDDSGDSDDSDDDNYNYDDSDDKDVHHTKTNDVFYFFVSLRLSFILCSYNLSTHI
jgi:hypothetical protein